MRAAHLLTVYHSIWGRGEVSAWDVSAQGVSAQVDVCLRECLLRRVFAYGGVCPVTSVSLCLLLTL